MALNKSSRNLPWLLGMGALCLLYGVGNLYVENHFSTLPTVVLFIGLACMVVCVVALKKVARRSTQASPWEKYGFVALAVVLFGIFVVGINYLASRYNGRWDVTQSGQHTLTESTSTLIKGLDREVQLTAFYVGLPPKYLEDLLKEYERVSVGTITSEIIDPIVQIGYAAQFGSFISGKEKKVIVRSGNERRDIDFTEGPLTEERLTNAIIRVTREERTAYFLTGHREYRLSDEGDTGLKILEKLLTANNIVSKSLMLGIEGRVPDDCDVLILAGLQNPLTGEEEKVINTYLEEGGDALFLIEHTFVTTPDKPLTEEEKEKNPSLNNILGNWGIEIGSDIVVDLDSHVGADVGSPATRNYMAHRALTQNLDYTFYVRPRSISILEDRRESIKLVPVVLTASKEKSWAETDRTLKIKFDEGLDKPGPVSIAFVIFEPKEEHELSDTRMIVFTDADFLTNAFIGQYSNAEMGLNAINWLLEVDYQALINQKEIKVSRLDLTSKQQRMVGVVLFAIPFLVAVSGVMVWTQQRD